MPVEVLGYGRMWLKEVALTEDDPASRMLEDSDRIPKHELLVNDRG